MEICFKFKLVSCIQTEKNLGARWLSGRVSERGQGFETYLRRVVSLSKTLYSLKVLVIPRMQWLHADMTEKLLTGTLSINTNKQTNSNNTPGHKLIFVQVNKVSPDVTQGGQLPLHILSFLQGPHSHLCWTRT